MPEEFPLLEPSLLAGEIPPEDTPDELPEIFLTLPVEKIKISDHFLSTLREVELPEFRNIISDSRLENSIPKRYDKIFPLENTEYPLSEEKILIQALKNNQKYRRDFEYPELQRLNAIFVTEESFKQRRLKVSQMIGLYALSDMLRGPRVSMIVRQEDAFWGAIAMAKTLTTDYKEVRETAPSLTWMRRRNELIDAAIASGADPARADWKFVELSGRSNPLPNLVLKPPFLKAS